MSDANGHKVVVDQSTFTLREMAAIDRMTDGAFQRAGEPGVAPELMAAFATVVMQRTDPDFTFDQALDFSPSQIELIGEAPEVSGGGGMTQPSSPESGTSIPST